MRGNTSEAASNTAVGMAQKLLLFWRKPARRCWWEGVELDSVDSLEGKKLKVWIRRVWTLEMVRIIKEIMLFTGTDLAAECNRAPLNRLCAISKHCSQNSSFEYSPHFITGCPGRLFDEKWVGYPVLQLQLFSLCRQVLVRNGFFKAALVERRGRRSLIISSSRSKEFLLRVANAP